MQARVQGTGRTAQPIAPARHSASLILMRAAASPEILLVERSAKLGFAALAKVFPGGKLDRADRLAERRYGPAHPHLPAGVRLAAIRETFEETGILLAEPANAPTIQDCLGYRDLIALRRAINQTPALFQRFLCANALVPALERLTPFACWVTPHVFPKRFITWFFIAEVSGETRVLVDGQETIAHEWRTAAQIITDRLAGRTKMIFPTIRMVERLAQAPSVATAIDVARRTPWATPILAAEILEAGKAWITIPPGLGYPVTREPAETAHRL